MFPKYVSHIAERMNPADGDPSPRNAEPKGARRIATDYEQREQRLRLGAWLAALTAAAVGVVWLAN